MIAWVEHTADNCTDVVKIYRHGWTHEVYIIRDDPWDLLPTLPSDTFTQQIREMSEKERLRLKHKAECQRAFNRPPKRLGRGYSPPKKWGPRPQTHSIRRGGRDW